MIEAIEQEVKAQVLQEARVVTATVSSLCCTVAI
jgi:hypothetical protein